MAEKLCLKWEDIQENTVKTFSELKKQEDSNVTLEKRVSLKWDDFQKNTIKNLSNLRKEDDFFDVTLVSEDLKQVMAHKVVLSSCSAFFKNILKTNKHSHPLICLTGITSIELENILDYAYHGEAQIFQEDINKFLDIARTLKMDGLLAFKTENEDFENEMITNQSNAKSPKKESLQMTENPPKGQKVIKDELTDDPVSTILLRGTFYSTVDEVEQKVLEYLGKNEYGDYICTVCGKIGGSLPGRGRLVRNLKNHIETHLKISLPCNFCGKHYSSRNSFNSHKTRFH